MKTRLGISAGMLAAAMYFAGLVSGYVVLALMVGYVLLVEPNPWLRKTAVKAFMVSLIFSLINLLIGFIPALLGMLYDLLSIFEVFLNLNVIYTLVELLRSAINLLGDILMLVLGVLALNQSTIPLGPIDNVIHKHM